MLLSIRCVCQNTVCLRHIASVTGCCSEANGEPREGQRKREGPKVRCARCVCKCQSEGIRGGW